MIIDEFLTTEITDLTEDKASQAMCLFHRYLLCSFGICHFIMNDNNEETNRKLVKPYIDEIQIAIVYLEHHMEEAFSDDVRTNICLNKVINKSWFYLEKEVKNYSKSNQVTKQGILEQLKLAHYYAFELLKIMIKHEDDDAKNLTNLKN